MALSKDWRLKTHISFFLIFPVGNKSHLKIWEKNPVGIFKIPTGKNFSHGIFKIYMGLLSLSSHLKPKTKYFLEQNI